MGKPGGRPDEKPDNCPVCGTPVSPGGPGDEPPCPTCGHFLWFMSRRVGGVTVIRLLDNRMAVVELLDLLDDVVGDGRADRLVINFEKIQQVSSAALGKLVKLMNRAGTVRGKLSLCGLHADLRQVFRITRLDRVFEIHETEAEALAASGLS